MPRPRTEVNVDGLPRTAHLIAWGHHPDHGWIAAITWLESGFGAALCTAWVAGQSVHATTGSDYSQIPRLQLDGPPHTWPVPPTDWGGGPYPGIHAHWLWIPAGTTIPVDTHSFSRG